MLKAFDIHCRILLTTRNRSLADCVSGMWAGFYSVTGLKVGQALKVLNLCFVSKGAKYEVEVESGLDEKKGLEILALYTQMKPHSLPEEARCIVRECKGTKIHKTLFCIW